MRRGQAMSMTTESHLDRLGRADERLYRKLSNLKRQADQSQPCIEHDGIVWVPPGWGMAYWDKGLRYRAADGGKAIKFRELGPEALHEMVGKFDDFVAFILDKYGVNLEPPAGPGGGMTHLVKYALSPAYRARMAEEAKLRKIRDGLEKLEAAKEEAAGKLKELEEKEKELIAQGKQSSEAARKRLVPRIAQVREDAGREATVIKFADAKMKSMKTALHNTKLTELGQIAGLDEDELADTQAQAEETKESVERAVLESTSVDFDLETADQAAIMAELAADDEKPEDERREEEKILDELSSDDEVDEDEVDEDEPPAKAEEADVPF